MGNEREDFGSIFKRRRVECRFSQEEIAERTSLSLDTIRRIESGRVSCSQIKKLFPEAWEAIENLFGRCIDIENLVGTTNTDLHTLPGTVLSKEIIQEIEDIVREMHDDGLENIPDQSLAGQGDEPYSSNNIIEVPGSYCTRGHPIPISDEWCPRCGRGSDSSQ